MIGGIVDIIVYEVREDGYVGEFIKVIGGNWGSIMVDEEYLVYFKKFIGEIIIIYINFNILEVFFKVFREFENVKFKIGFEFDKKLRIRFFYYIREVYKNVYFDILFNNDYVWMSLEDVK